MKIVEKNKMIKIITGDKKPFYKEVNAHIIFEYKNHKFAFLPYSNEKLHEFTHIKSGLGFNGSFEKYIKHFEKSFKVAINRVGEDNFLELINSVPDFKTAVEQFKIKHLTNIKRRAIWKTLNNSLPTGINIPIDGLSTAVTGTLIIDLMKFDDLLINRYKGEYNENTSMNDFLKGKFGEGFVNKLEKIL